MSEARCCPVCGGKGIVANGFYSTPGFLWSSSSTAPEICRSCHGSGVVWIGDGPPDNGFALPDIPAPDKQEEKTDKPEIEWKRAGDSPSNPTPGEEVLVTVIDNSGDREWRYTTVGWYTGWNDKWVVDNELTAWVEYWANMPEPKED